MSSAAPKRVMDEIYAEVCRQADVHRYMLQGRAENSKFMDDLAKHPKVGKRLQEFQPPEEIRHWIKDVALHNYAAEKRQPPRDSDSLLRATVGKAVSELHYDERDRLSVHRAADGECLLVVRGTYIKWETALRKLLLYRARRAQQAQGASVDFRMFLYVHFVEGESVNAGDRRLVDEALRLISVTALWA